MKRFLILALLICAMSLATFAGAGETVAGSVTNPADDARASVVASNMNTSFDRDFLAFIHTLYEEENYVISPLSFRAALMLAVEGADGSTRDQLLDAMGFASEEEMRQWYAAVRESVDFFDKWVDRQKQSAEEEARYYPRGEAPEMPAHAYRVLNSVWNNADVFGAFLPDYVASVEARYGATASSVPSGRITDAVNRWCDEATDGLIPRISDDLSECAAALVNAVYLRSSWLDEFSSRMTEPEDFTGIDGTVTRRDMMKDRGRYRFFEDEETRLISIPLNGGLAFVAVLGDDSDWLADYQAAEFTDVDLWIPKLDTQSDFGREALVQYLMDRGAVDAFNANTADFSRMADYPWYIGDILQKARIRTDEEGLEAAAVTTAMLAYGALRQEEPRYREFHAYEPFRYYIVTTQTQTPLVVFAGQEVR
jgi:serpin B